MINNIFLYAGSASIIIWGISHIIPTKSVVSGFGAISEDNKRLITMEWVAEGLSLCFIGVLVLFVTLLSRDQNQVSFIVYWASAMMLIIMAGLTAATGAKTSIVAIKICPIVKTSVAILFILGSIL